MTKNTNPVRMEEKVSLFKPTVEDGASMWNLVKHSTLDMNSAYKYLLMCEFFSETCVVAKNARNEVVGFVTAFIPPQKPDRVFVWQIGVDATMRGQGIGVRLLKELLQRKACENVNYLEATVTPSNEASQALFKRISKDYQTDCEISLGFPKNLFPEEDHEEELTFCVGPLQRSIHN